MKVKVKLFAAAREKAGADSLEVPVAPDATLQDLLDAFEQAYPWLKGLPGRWAVNLDFVASHQKIRPDDEVAFIPPVSGG